MILTVKFYFISAERDSIKNISGKSKPGSYEVIIFWNPPANPNGGHVLAYEIKFSRFVDKLRYMIDSKPDQVQMMHLLHELYNVVYPQNYRNDNN